MANQSEKQQSSGGMQSWSGARLPIKAFWMGEKGDTIRGVLLQRNRNPGGRVAAPFYVLQLTAPCEKTKMKNEIIPCEKGDNVAVAENIGLQGLDELLGYEVFLKVTDITEFNTEADGSGEIREVKVFDVKHSADVVNQAAAQRYRPQQTR